MKRYVVGVTGASGSLCARSILDALLGHPDVGEVHVVLSSYSLRTIQAELGVPIDDERAGLEALVGGTPGPRLVHHPSGAMEASISSGSFRTDGMLVVPCSGGTLAAIAQGVTSNLLHRAAEVTLKERRPLLLAFRETPLSLVHIENMRRATLAGAVVAPILPAFYARPQSLDDVVTQFTARLLDLLGLEHRLGRRWEGAER
ncbi:MAG TPA: UbiX family flavin prenyltransferase [Candidatus Polarisedimenticolia bacterium]|nr:UbiX family flavin prenyltransferase [Candidatus Polarisedimenticolia bacterium]